MQATTTHGITFPARSVGSIARATAGVAVLVGTAFITLAIANALSAGPAAPRSEVLPPAADPVTAGQAELDGWILEAGVTVPARGVVVVGEADRRDPVDPLAAGQANLEGWTLKAAVTAPADPASLDRGSDGGTARQGSDPLAAGQAELQGWIVP